MYSTAVHIRRYDKKDDNSLLELLRANIPNFFAESELQDYKEYLDRELEDYFVIEYSGEIVGAGGINYDLSTGTAKISWDFVHPNHQGKNMGSMLLQHRLVYLQSKTDIQAITVRTSQFAYNFYAKHGFELHEVVKDYWAPGFDLYAMHYRAEMQSA